MDVFIGGEMGPWPKKLDKEIDNQKHSIYLNTEKPLQDFLKKKNYGSGLTILGIIPMCFRPDIKLWQERRYYNSKKGEADYRLNIDYDAFVRADEAGKRKLIIENVLTAVRDIGVRAKRLKVEFDSERMERDIREFLQFKDELPLT